MHYHKNAFGHNTIEALDGRQTLGRSDGFSQLDIEGINMIYCGKRIIINENSAINNIIKAKL